MPRKASSEKPAKIVKKLPATDYGPGVLCTTALETDFRSRRIQRRRNLLFGGFLMVDLKRLQWLILQLIYTLKQPGINKCAHGQAVKSPAFQAGVAGSTPAGCTNAAMVEWHTRQFEGLVGEISCGFKSHWQHHFIWLRSSVAKSVGLSRRRSGVRVPSQSPCGRSSIGLEHWIVAPKVADSISVVHPIGVQCNW